MRAPLALALLFSMTLTGSALATSSGAWSLAHAEPENADCLVRASTTGVANECGHTVRVLMNLPVTSSGGKNIRMIAAAVPNTTAVVTCHAFSTNQTGSFESVTPHRSYGLTSASAEIRIDVAAVPPFGTLNVSCDLGPNASIRTLNW